MDLLTLKTSVEYLSQSVVNKNASIQSAFWLEYFSRTADWLIEPVNMWLVTDRLSLKLRIG